MLVKRGMEDGEWEMKKLKRGKLETVNAEFTLEDSDVYGDYPNQRPSLLNSLKRERTQSVYK